VSLGNPVTVAREGGFDDEVLRFEPGLDQFSMNTPMP